MCQARLCHIGRCAQQRLHCHFDTPSLALIIFIRSATWRCRAPVYKYGLAEDKELVGLERGKAPPKLEICAKVIVQELRVVMASDG